MPGGSHFAVVDQAVNMLKKVESYISAGMETTIDVSLDLVDNDKESGEDNEKLKELKDVMLQYAKMDRDLQQFLESVEYVKQQSSRVDEGTDLEEILEQKLSEIKANNHNEDLYNHEKYTDLQQKVWEALHPGETMASSMIPLLEDDEIAMTQQEINLKCPYTGQEMVDPVRNKNCGHSYERCGIMDYIKNKGRRARCPVGGCVQDKPLEISDLEDNKELKRFIDRKNRQGGKRTKHSEHATFSK